jgi:hypothetical protein
MLDKTTIRPFINRLEDRVYLPTIMVAVGTILLPFVVHLLPPVNGKPIGAILLPMFYIPLIGLLIFRRPGPVLIGAVLAPILNHLVTGRPPLSLLPIMEIELAVFTIVCLAFLRTPGLKYIAGPLGYLAVKFISSSLLILFPSLLENSKGFLSNSLATGLPGIMILLVLNLLILNGKAFDDRA